MPRRYASFARVSSSNIASISNASLPAIITAVDDTFSTYCLNPSISCLEPNMWICSGLLSPIFVLGNLPMSPSKTFSTIKESFSWFFIFNPGLLLTDNTPTTGEVYTHSYPVFGSPATITYKVLIKAYSGNGCVGEYFQDITVYAAPDVQFDPISPVCQEIPSITLSSAFDVFNNTGVGSYLGVGITNSPCILNKSETD